MNFVPAFPGERLRFLLQFMNQSGEIVPPPVGDYSCKFYEVEGGSVAFELTTASAAGLSVTSDGILFDKDLALIPDVKAITYLWHLTRNGPPIEYMADGEMTVASAGSGGARFRTFNSFNGALPQVSAPAFAPNLSATAVTIESGDLRYVRQSEFTTAVNALISTALTAIGAQTQASLVELISDTVMGTVVAGANVIVTPNDAANTLTISSTGLAPYIVSGVLTSTDTTDTTPSFLINTANATAGNIVTIQFATDALYTAGVGSQQNVLTGGEATANQLTLTILSAITPAVRYARFKIQDSAWVNLSSTTFTITSPITPTIPTPTLEVIYPIVASTAKFNYRSPLLSMVGLTITQWASTDPSVPDVPATLKVIHPNIAQAEVDTGLLSPPISFGAQANAVYYSKFKLTNSSETSDWSPIVSYIVDTNAALVVTRAAAATDLTLNPQITVTSTAATAGDVIDFRARDTVSGAIINYASATVGASGALNITSAVPASNLPLGTYEYQARRNGLTWYSSPQYVVTKAVVQKAVQHLGAGFNNGSTPTTFTLNTAGTAINIGTQTNANRKVFFSLVINGVGLPVASPLLKVKPLTTDTLVAATLISTKSGNIPGNSDSVSYIYMIDNTTHPTLATATTLNTVEFSGTGDFGFSVAMISAEDAAVPTASDHILTIRASAAGPAPLSLTIPTGGKAIIAALKGDSANTISSWTGATVASGATFASGNTYSGGAYTTTDGTVPISIAYTGTTWMATSSLVLRGA